MTSVSQSNWDVKADLDWEPDVMYSDRDLMKKTRPKAFKLVALGRDKNLIEVKIRLAALGHDPISWHQAPCLFEP